MKPSRPELSREFVAAHKRRRMMDAMAGLSAELGYEATKIADIVRRAGVARKTLYDNFDGKEALFLATFDALLVEVKETIEAGCRSADDVWAKRVENGLEALLEFLAQRPALARLGMVEVLSATPAASARYNAAIQEFVELLRRSTPEDPSLPGTIEEALVGGVAWILHQQIRAGKTAQALELLPELSDFVLSPYHGVAELGAQPRGESDSTVADSST